jgi:hypothetical protein
LSPDQLLDVAEGAADAASAAHATSCGRCSGEVSRLRAALSAVSEVGVPEPSPLFWDHFSARVHGAIAAEAAPVPPNVTRASSFFVRPAMIAGVVVLLIAAALSWRANAPVVALDPGAGAEARLAPSGSGVATPAPVEDASLDLLADLAADLDWDDATAAGFGLSAGSVDRAVVELTATEREELHRLLTVEMAGKVL